MFTHSVRRLEKIRLVFCQCSTASFRSILPCSFRSRIRIWCDIVLYFEMLTTVIKHGYMSCWKCSISFNLSIFLISLSSTKCFRPQDSKSIIFSLSWHWQSCHSQSPHSFWCWCWSAPAISPPHSTSKHYCFPSTGFLSLPTSDSHLKALSNPAFCTTFPSTLRLYHLCICVTRMIFYHQNVTIDSLSYCLEVLH